MTDPLYDVLQRDDCLSGPEIAEISNRIAAGDVTLLDRWLVNVAMGDGTNNEAKLAAILSGVLAELKAIGLRQSPTPVARNPIMGIE